MVPLQQGVEDIVKQLMRTASQSSNSSSSILLSSALKGDLPTDERLFAEIGLPQLARDTPPPGSQSSPDTASASLNTLAPLISSLMPSPSDTDVLASLDRMLIVGQTKDSSVVPPASPKDDLDSLLPALPEHLGLAEVETLVGVKSYDSHRRSQSAYLSDSKTVNYFDILVDSGVVDDYEGSEVDTNVLEASEGTEPLLHPNHWRGLVVGALEAALREGGSGDGSGSGGGGDNQGGKTGETEEGGARDSDTLFLGGSDGDIIYEEESGEHEDNQDVMTQGRKKNSSSPGTSELVALLCRLTDQRAKLERGAVKLSCALEANRLKDNTIAMMTNEVTAEREMYVRRIHELEEEVNQRMAEIERLREEGTRGHEAVVALERMLVDERAKAVRAEEDAKRESNKELAACRHIIATLKSVIEKCVCDAAVQHWAKIRRGGPTSHAAPETNQDPEEGNEAKDEDVSQSMRTGEDDGADGGDGSDHEGQRGETDMKVRRSVKGDHQGEGMTRRRGIGRRASGRRVVESEDEESVTVKGSDNWRPGSRYAVYESQGVMTESPHKIHRTLAKTEERINERAKRQVAMQRLTEERETVERKRVSGRTTRDEKVVMKKVVGNAEDETSWRGGDHTRTTDDNISSPSILQDDDDNDSGLGSTVSTLTDRGDDGVSTEDDDYSKKTCDVYDTNARGPTQREDDSDNDDDDVLNLLNDLDSSNNADPTVSFTPRRAIQPRHISMTTQSSYPSDQTNMVSVSTVASHEPSGDNYAPNASREGATHPSPSTFSSLPLTPDPSLVPRSVSDSFDISGVFVPPSTAPSPRLPPSPSRSLPIPTSTTTGPRLRMALPSRTPSMIAPPSSLPSPQPPPPRRQDRDQGQTSPRTSRIAASLARVSLPPLPSTTVSSSSSSSSHSTSSSLNVSSNSLAFDLDNV